MVRAIYRAVCDGAGPTGEAGDAIAALVDLGLTTGLARNRVRAALKKNPKATAARLIEAAPKERAG